METKNSYFINKGISRSVESKELKAQYLFIFVGRLLSVLTLVMILYTVEISSFVCLGVGVSMVNLVVWQTSSLNQKCDEHGLVKQAARKRHPKYLRHQRLSRQFIRYPKPKTTLNEK